MMAFDAGSIVVYFKAQTAELVKGIQESNERLDGFKKGVEGLGAFKAFQVITSEIVDCVQASSEAEINIRKLQATASSRADVSTFQNLATQLSYVTTFSDDAAMSALSLLGKFNLTDQQMGELLPKIADFAAFMGTDLPTAAEAAGKAIANGSGGLRGLGLGFTVAQKQAFEMATQQERVNILLDKMGDKFTGVAAAVASTGAGGITQFHKEIGELEEALGGLIDAPVGMFFNGLAEIVRGLNNAISNMGDTTRTVVAIVGTVVGAFAAATAATLAWGASMKFLDGAPSILRSVGAAASTVATTFMTIIAPLAVIASTVVMLEGMYSRIRAGNFDMNESFIDGIKNNFKAGLNDIEGAFKNVFEAPKQSAADLDKSLKSLDNTAQKLTMSLPIDFKNELSQATHGDAYAELGNSIGLDFSKHVNENGVELTGDALIDAQTADAANSTAIASAVNPDVAQAGADTGMSKEAIDATAAHLKTTISGTDLAVAGMEGGLKQLAGRMGGAASAIMGAVKQMASGDIVGGIVSLGIEMLTRTKSFGALMQSVEKIFTSLAQILDPLVAAVIPFLDIVSDLVPIIITLNPEIKMLAVVIKAIGDLLLSFINFIGGFWNGLVGTIANFVSAIPFIGDDIAEWIRGAEIQTAQTQADPALKGAVTDSTTKINGLGDAAAKTSESLQNVPSGFKIAAARYAAIIRGEGDPGQSVSPSASPGGGGRSIGSLPGGGFSGIRTAAGTGPAMAQVAAAPTTVPSIYVQAMNVVTNQKPSAIAAAITSQAKQTAFLKTGQTTPGATTRGYWGA